MSKKSVFCIATSRTQAESIVGKPQKLKFLEQRHFGLVR